MKRASALEQQWKRRTQAEMERIEDLPVLKLPVSELLFSQKSISDKMSDKHDHRRKVPLAEALEKLRSGQIHVDDFKPLEIYWKKGRLYSCDNRRLCLFKQLSKELGRDLTVKVKLLNTNNYDDENWCRHPVSNDPGNSHVYVRGWFQDCPIRDGRAAAASTVAPVRLSNILLESAPKRRRLDPPPFQGSVAKAFLFS